MSSSSGAVRDDNTNRDESSAARSEIIRLALDFLLSRQVHDKVANSPRSTGTAITSAVRQQQTSSGGGGGGPSTDADKNRFAHVLADAVDDDVSLAKKILQDQNIATLRDIAAHYGFSRVKSLAGGGETGGGTVGTQSATVQTTTSSSSTQTTPSPRRSPEQAARLALRFRRCMFTAEPTAVLQQMIASDDEETNPSENLPIHDSPEVIKEVARFLARKPEFNIRMTSVMSVLKQDDANMKEMDPEFRTEVRESLKLLQRVQALAPAPEAIRPLLEQNLTSALRLSSVPKKRFVGAFASRLVGNGATPDEAEVMAAKIHHHAMSSRLRADHALIQIHQAIRGSGLRVIDGETSLADRRSMFDKITQQEEDSSKNPCTPAPVNLDALFADMDMCECEACLDVTSPTAYYVDLLQYLRNNNLDTGPQWDNTGKEGWTNTALEKLFIRRPDLQHLQLTCANANTALPMIDLANEVMEAFVIHAADFANTGKAVVETWNVKREVTEELLASPSHTRKKAYCILKEARYPIASLPYFQPLDASRLYLNYLGTSRFELIDTFRLAEQWSVRAALVGTSPGKTARYLQLHDQIQDRAVAAEYLGIDPDEYIIITRESFWPIGCSEFADNGTMIDEETYLRDIGVVELFKYWGYTTDDDLLSMDNTDKTGLSFVKAQFLGRSGLSFAETVDLLTTKYVNPMMPTGRDKVLLDAIRYSYRFLQHLTVGMASDAERNSAISSFLFKTQCWVHIILLLQVPPTGNELVKPDISTPTFTECEIKAWVAKWFNCIGKLIVLESGAGPRLDVQGYLVWTPRGIEHTVQRGEVTTSIIPSTSQNTPKVLGYLDHTGDIRDDKDELLGFVWMNGQVIYSGLQPIRHTYPTGKIYLVQIPKQEVTPTVEQLGNASQEGSYVEVENESHLMEWRYEYWRVVRWQIPPDTCSIENTTLIHINGKPVEIWEWDRINRLLRLYRKVQESGWTISQLDAALVGLWKVPELPPPPPPTPDSDEPNPQTPEEGPGFSFSDFKDKGCDTMEGSCDDDGNGDDTEISPCDPRNYINIGPGFLKELKSVKQLAGLTGVELEKLLCLWGDIGILGEKSLYSRLFLTHDLEAMDPVFVPDDNGNYLSAQPKIGDHIPVISSALRLKPDIFDAVLQRVGLTRDSIITIPNLTKLYRHSLFSTILGIKPKSLVDALDLFPNPYESASATLGLYRLWTRISDASFTIKQLRYIILGLDDPLRPIGPDKIKTLRTTKTIVDGLAAIDAAQPDLTAQEEAVLTAAQVKTKATLFFTPSVVDDILGLTEGTRLFTTNAPVGLVVDESKISAKLVYKDPLTPPNRRATLSATGCLTETELADGLELFPGNNGWSSALQRLQRQAQNLVKNQLGVIFVDDVDEAIQILTEGDVPPTQDPSGVVTDPGTSLKKRVFLMKKFLPLLRTYLYTNSIVAAMSSVAPVTPEICAWLLRDVIKVGSGNDQKSAIDVLIGLKGHGGTTDGSRSWTGFLLPPSTDTYVFYGFGETQPAPLILGGTSVSFVTRGEDPSDIWWTTPVSLVGGKIISLQIRGQTIPGDLSWKTARSGVTPVPPSSLIPDDSVSDAATVFAPLSKASMAIQGFALDLTEAQHFQAHKPDFSDLDFGRITLDSWKRLLGYSELKKLLPSREMRLVDLFKWATLRETATPDEISQTISATTVWDTDTIKILLGKKKLNLVDVKLFRDERALSKLSKIFELIRRVGLSDIKLLTSWTDLKLDFKPTWNLAKSIRQAIRSKYTASDYEQAIKPSHDMLRKHQRDALIAYLLVQPAIQRWGVTDADGLFEFFLLDVQMGSCMQTSRTKQAISSVQLFVKRCLLGQEEKYGVPNDALDSERWEWMSKQTVWTANRKVFLYPENWLVPSLRDNKTPIYSDMESEMLQKEINPSSALDSFKSYVTKLAEIAQLRAVGVYVEETVDQTKVVHCVAMTIASPTIFFYRKCDLFTREWTPWVRISVDIPVYTVDFSTAPIIPIRLAPAAEETPGIAPVGPILDPVIDDGAGGKQYISFFTGCYVIPVSWQSRTFVFIGEITKKAVPNTDALGTSFNDMSKPKSDSNKITDANTAGPKELWELNLSWTEYRSGKWTQKQVAASACQTGATFPAKTPPIQAFQFMPRIVKTEDGGQYINVEIWRWDPSSSSPTPWFLGDYSFDGTLLQKNNDDTFPPTPNNWVPTTFQATGGFSSRTVSSLQKSGDNQKMAYINTVPYVKYSQDPNGVVHYTATTKDEDIFYHPFSSRLVSAASTATDKTTIEPIEAVYRSLAENLIDPAFGTGPSETGGDGSQHPTYAELSKPYTNYNWELGFHGPMQVADALLRSQQFDDSLSIIHQVFNPYADGTDITRVWRWYPFQRASSWRVLETTLNGLKPRQFDLNITKWRDHPFQPFVVARGRTVAYMKWTVMLYIKILIAYGDMYFRRRTLEDIPLAIQMYVLASHLYGPKGETIPKQGKKIPQTYYSLMDKWDAFSNAVVQLEVAFPYSNQTPFPWGSLSDGSDSESEKHAKQIALANIFGFDTTSYFCLPSNPDLQALRNTIDQRLYNIRHCLDIDGRPLPLVLWDAPIDPGELVAAVASGLSLSSALNDQNASLPNYRFSWLLARALEITGELKSLESTFLSIKEKRDSEALQVLRNGHEIVMHKMVMEMKKIQLQEAQRTLIALQTSQESSKNRFDYYSTLAGVDVQPLDSIKQPFVALKLEIDSPSGGDLHLNRSETQEQDQAITAQHWNKEAANLEVMAGILHALPSFNVHGTPFGCGIEVAWGMPNVAAAFSAQARQNQVYSSDSSFGSTQAGRKATFVKQYQDRVHQMNLAGLEFNHINTQIEAQETRVKISNLDLANQQKLIDNATEVEEFLSNKYTNDELYSYLENSMRTSLYQTYLLAYDLAKKAEQGFRFERRPTSAQDATDFISFGYFNPARDGLQASQQLYLALKSMDVAYQETRGHDYEITKAVSLRQLNPYALLTLRETGSCTFDVPEVHFDMDFPGHFFRRIKTASLTIPCVVGPYVGVNATLRLVKHRYRADSLAGSARDYVEDTESGQPDRRFRSGIIPIDAVATSSAQNDSGAFELSLKDERYLPFEGAGAVSTWQVMLPPKEFPPFDYSSIADVVLSLKYTSCEGGDSLRRAAAESVVQWLGSVEGQSKEVGLLALWDIKAEFAAEWAKLSGPASSSNPAGGGEDVRALVLKGLNGRLPSFVAGRDISKVKAKDVSLVTNLGISQAADLSIDFKYVAGGDGESETSFDSGPTKVGGSMSMFRISEADDAIADWALKVKMSADVKVDAKSRMWIVTRYVLLKA